MERGQQAVKACSQGYSRVVHGYSSYISRNPRKSLAVSVAFMVFMSAISFIVRPEALPDLDSPEKGMEPRGTYISGASRTLFRKLGDAGFSDTATDTPSLNRRRRRLASCQEGLLNSFFFEMVLEDSAGGGTGTGNGILNLPTMQALCDFESQFNSAGFEVQPPCEFRALHNHIAFYYGLGTCRNITGDDVSNFTQVLVDCLPLYESGALALCLQGCPAPGVPEECTRGNYVFDALHSLIDKDFSAANPRVGFTKLIRVRDIESEEMETLHFDFLVPKVGEAFGSAVLRGYGDTFGEYKFDVFSTQLLMDIAFVLVALGLIYTIMFIHTQSLFITTFAFLQILLALTVSYGFYNVILWLPFFPYLNLVSAFLVMGIGVDDVFVLYDAWLQSAVQTGSPDFTTRMAYCLESAGGSLITTSLTTSSAFFSIAFSTPITALRCFGIFCGLVIMVDFFLMITYFPALIIFYEKYVKNSKRCCKRYNECTSQEGKETELGRTEIFFRDTIGPAVIKLRYPLILLCLGVAGGIGSQLFNIKRSTSATLQFYIDSNPFEAYDLGLKQRFNVFISPSTSGEKLDAHFVFGVDPADNGNFLDPDDKGTLELLPMNPFLAQEWLADFCDNVRKQSFYFSPADPFTELCFFEFFRGWVNASCAETSPIPLGSGGNYSDYFPVPARSQCCNISYPVEEASEFDFCLRACAGFLDTSGFPSGLGFSGNSLVSIQYRFLTNQVFTEEFEPMDTLFNKMEAFRKSQRATAPIGSGMGSFFFASSFVNLDLQRFLFEGAIQSFAVSMIIALIVVLLMTRSLLLSILSILTLVAIVALIYGVIVLLGWELNIFESVIFSVAVGLSVDFTVHYSHSYLHANLDSRRANVLKMYEVMGVSLLYGAISTFASGFALTFAQTLFFYKFGIFLMLTMSISLIFANVLLPPLLYLFGPVKSSAVTSEEDKKLLNVGATADEKPTL